MTQDWKEEFKQKSSKRIQDGGFLHPNSDIPDGFIANVENQVAFIEQLLAAQRKEIEDKVRQYKNHYNPIGDERNTGKHEACDAILSFLSEPTPEGK